jgi:hypothetical protein
MIVLGVVLCAGAASAQNFDCRKAKAAAFAGSTTDVTSAFASQVGVTVKKAFLYCDEAGIAGAPPAGSAKQVCYKVKGTKTADAPRSTTDAFGSLSLTVKSKTFVLCVPAT